MSNNQKYVPMSKEQLAAMAGDFGIPNGDASSTSNKSNSGVNGVNNRPPNNAPKPSPKPRNSPPPDVGFLDLEGALASIGELLPSAPTSTPVGGFMAQQANYMATFKHAFDLDAVTKHALHSERIFIQRLLVAGEWPKLPNYLAQLPLDGGHFWPCNQELITVLSKLHTQQVAERQDNNQMTPPTFETILAVGGDSLITLFENTERLQMAVQPSVDAIPMALLVDAIKSATARRLMDSKLAEVQMTLASGGDVQAATAALNELVKAPLLHTSGANRAKPLSARELLEKRNKAAEAGREHFKKHGVVPLLGLSTGFKSVDRLINGLMARQTTLVSGAPASGKSALCLNMALNVARRLKEAQAKGDSQAGRVLIISSEISEEIMAARAIGILAGLPYLEAGYYGIIQDGPEKAKQEAALEKAVSLFEQLPLSIITATQFNANAVMSYVVDEQHDKGAPVRLLVVDGIYGASPNNPATKASAYEKMGTAMAEFDEMAKLLNVALLAVHQPTKAAHDAKADVNLNIALRDASQMAQIAQSVIFIGSNNDEDETNQAQVKSVPVFVLKSRDGQSSNNLRLGFHGPSGRWYENSQSA